MSLKLYQTELTCESTSVTCWFIAAYSWWCCGRNIPAEMDGYQGIYYIEYVSVCHWWGTVSTTLRLSKEQLYEMQASGYLMCTGISLWIFAHLSTMCLFNECAVWNWVIAPHRRCRAIIYFLARQMTHINQRKLFPHANMKCHETFVRTLLV